MTTLNHTSNSSFDYRISKRHARQIIQQLAKDLREQHGEKEIIDNQELRALVNHFYEIDDKQISWVSQIYVTLIKIRVSADSDDPTFESIIGSTQTANQHPTKIINCKKITARFCNKLIEYLCTMTKESSVWRYPASY